MDDHYKSEKPATLYVAPECGLKIQYDAFAYSAEFGLEYTVLNINDFPLSERPKEIRGWLSPMRDVTLPLDVKLTVGIHPDAAKFSYLYPPRGLADYIDWENISSTSKDGTNKLALPYVASFGGYAYFNEDCDLLGVNAISLKETPYELSFDGPFTATKTAYREINDLNRYQSLYLDVLGEIGFIGSAWMDPGDNKFLDNTIQGQENIENKHGGFLYFKHDKTAVIFLIDGDDSLFTPSLGIGSLLSDAFRLCKHQLRSTTLSTTCPSTSQTAKDKIHRACEEGSKVGVRYWLKEHSKSQKKVLLHKDTFGWCPLHYACCYNAQDEDLIQLLVESCPEAIHVKNNNDLLPLHLACNNNPSIEVIKLLLKYDDTKKSIQSKSKHHGLLPVHFACSNSSTSIEVIRLLFLLDETKTTLVKKSKLGWTSLHMAIAGNHNDAVVQLLMRFSTESSHLEDTPIVLERVKGLLPIQLACLKGCSVDIVSTLLEADSEGATFYDVVECCNEYSLVNATILHIALSNSPSEVVDLLLMKEIKSRCMPSREVVNLLEVKESYDGRLPMHIAAARKDLKAHTYNTLLGLNRLSVYSVDKDGNTPLHLLCMNQDVDEQLIKMFLDSANASIRELKGKQIPLTRMYNHCKQTPLCLAIQNLAYGGHLLFSPEHICLKGIHHEAKENLLSLVVNDYRIQKHVVKNLAERQYFFLIALELVSNIVATCVYFNASNNLIVTNKSISTIETFVLISCATVFMLRELLQLKSTTLIEYFFDGWNWIENSSIFMLSAATYHMVELRGDENMAPKRILFTWSGVLLLLQFIFIIRTTFLPFARFVAGLMAIFYTLIPFFVVSVMCLLAFTYSFLMSGGRAEECPDFGTCFLWTLQGFFFGMDDFQKTPFLDIIFGIVGVVVLLNVVIAIVSNAWDDSIDDTKEVFWQSRVDILFQYRFFKNIIGKKSCFGFLFRMIDSASVFSTKKEDSKICFCHLLLKLVLDFVWFLLGLITLGLGWPEKIRQNILSAGM